jgi:hypothetical protein
MRVRISRGNGEPKNCPSVGLPKLESNHWQGNCFPKAEEKMNRSRLEFGTFQSVNTEFDAVDFLFAQAAFFHLTIKTL